MLFRAIKRAPWIGLGAAAAYYLDGSCGPERRAEAKAWLHDQWDRTKGQVSEMSSGDPTERRADEVLPEERSAGVDAPADDMAKRILEESEQRTVDRPGTTEETRKSSETVAPVDRGSTTAGARSV